jgi:transposase
VLGHLKRSSKPSIDETPATVLDPGRGKTKKEHFRAHPRHKFYELTHNNVTPIANEGLKQIAILCQIEAQARDKIADNRPTFRQTKTAPKIAMFTISLDRALGQVSTKPPTSEALKYIAKYWNELILFLRVSCIEIDSIPVERIIRPIALQGKTRSSQAATQGRKTWAMLASLVETWKPENVEPHGDLTGVLAVIVNGHKQKRHQPTATVELRKVGRQSSTYCETSKQ